MNRVWLTPPFDRLWAEHDPFQAVEELQGEVYRELEARRTARVEVEGRAYFVKIHRGVGWFEIIENLLRGRLPVLGANNELAAIRRLEALGVATMRPVAFGERGSNPATRRSFIITEALAPTVALDTHCRAWRERPPALRWRHAVIERVADITRRMHRGGMNHRDFYLVHFLLHLEPAPTPADFRVSLIDLHRAQLRRATPRRWRDKDLAALYFASLEAGLTTRDRLRFLCAYFACPLRETFRRETRLLRFLDQEGERLLRRWYRKFAPPEETPPH